MELPRAVGKPPAETPEGGRSGWGGRVTTSATYGRRPAPVTVVSADLGTFPMESQPNQRRVTKRRSCQAS